jgi:LysM repeat protein
MRLTHSRWLFVSTLATSLAGGIYIWSAKGGQTPSATASPRSAATASPGIGKNANPAAVPAKSARPASASPSQPASVAQPAAPFVPPEGTKAISHAVQRGESVTSIASHYFAESVYMRRNELEDAIRQANGLRGNALKPGAEIEVPGIPLQPILDKPVTVPRDFDARGIYLTAYTAGSSSGLDLMKRWKDAGGNAVVFDLKDYDGLVHVPFDHAYAPHDEITIRNLPKLIHYIHSLQMHAIARIAIFRDHYQAQNHSELAIHSRKTGKPWLEGGKLAWVDPSLPAVQQYDLDLARLGASAGADEIQFDYVRFPAEGDQADALFAYQKDHPEWPRTKVITDFVTRAYETLHPYNVLFSLDVFGVMAWERPVDLRLTGQEIPSLARHCDVLSPMIYPSHFFGFDGYQVPGDAPEHFISESMQRFEEATKGSGVVLRPWLQAFAWHTKSYSPDYIRIQVRVAKEGGGVGFLFWNARNDYSKPFAAMPDLRLNAGRESHSEIPVPPLTEGAVERAR